MNSRTKNSTSTSKGRNVVFTTLILRQYSKASIRGNVETIKLENIRAQLIRYLKKLARKAIKTDARSSRAVKGAKGLDASVTQFFEENLQYFNDNAELFETSKDPAHSDSTKSFNMTYCKEFYSHALVLELHRLVIKSLFNSKLLMPFMRMRVNAGFCEECYTNLMCTFLLSRYFLCEEDRGEKAQLQRIDKLRLERWPSHLYFHGQVKTSIEGETRVLQEMNQETLSSIMAPSNEYGLTSLLDLI
mmetsp:Transcript_10948/g.21420  ORF Transcript_10948/g.21420 Transcript_10948/m.21420 type:complete len:246 (+) Transcript_10948:925-1662(+)